jgi:urease beta subunit
MGQAALKTYPKMSADSRKRAYAAISINFMKMRPDLKHESKDIVREERLAFITELLDRKHPVTSLTALTDSNIHFVLDRMNAQLKPKMSAETTAIKIVPGAYQEAKIIHLTQEPQRWAIEKLISYLEWTQEYKEDYLTKRWKTKSERMLTTAQANSFTFQLLKTAASKDLKSLGKETKGKATLNHIPIIKAKLGIDQTK